MATIADVARRAGVAPSTVSYVLTNRRRISPPTRKAVERAIRDLDYRPHAGARALRGARTRVLALSFPLEIGHYHSIGRPFRPPHEHRRPHPRPRPAAAVRRGEHRGAPAGAGQPARRRRGPHVGAHRRPAHPCAAKDRVAGLGARPPAAIRAACPWCDYDFEGAAALAVRELIRAGHRSVAFVGSTDADFRAGLNLRSTGCRRRPGGRAGGGHPADGGAGLTVTPRHWCGGSARSCPRVRYRPP